MAKKPSKLAMEKRIRIAANNLAAAVPSLTSQVGKTFETWVMFHIAAQLKLNGFGVRVLDSNCNATTTFNVRGGPGHIPPLNTNAANSPCHFELQGTFAAFEMHNSVEHLGNSATLHELDLSIVFNLHAHRIRTRGGGPFAGSRIFGAELKAFSFGAPVDKTVARVLVGVAVDLDSSIFVRQLDVRFGSDTVPSVSWRLGDIPNYWLTTTTSVTADTRQYLSRYTIGVAEGLDPSISPSPASPLPVTPLSAMVQSIQSRLVTARTW